MGKIIKEPFSDIAAVRVTEAGGTAEGLDRVQAFLARFGYISGRVQWSNRLDDVTAKALRRYQRFYKLDRTGAFDDATKWSGA